MKYIDLANWKRKDLFIKYQHYGFPYIIISADINITKLYIFSRKHNISFYFSMIHTVTKTALSIENFKYRIVNNHPAVCNTLTPVFTYLFPEQEQFFLASEPYEKDIISFCHNTKRTVNGIFQSQLFEYKLAQGKNDVLYITAMPWVQYTHFTRTIELAETDSIPRLSWGKFYDTQDGEKMIPFSVQVHHGLMDGYHVGLFFERFQKNLSLI